MSCNRHAARPIELGLTQWFPWGECIHDVDRHDLRITSPGPGGNWMSYVIYPAPKATRWIDRIETCAVGILVAAAYRRRSAFKIYLERYERRKLGAKRSPIQYPT